MNTTVNNPASETQSRVWVQYDPEDWRGAPYLPCLAPSVSPGQVDRLEVIIRLPGGASAAHAFGAGERTDRIDAALKAILNFGKRNTAAIDVLAERRRQIEEEGWTPEHDDEHRAGVLSGAAACYARNAFDRRSVKGRLDAPVGWPFNQRVWKPDAPRRDLVKAAALILAEIERLDRMEARDG